MARLNQLPRARRRRLAVSFGWVIALVGTAMFPALARNVSLLDPIMLVAVVVFTFGLLLAWWGGRGHRRAKEADHQALARTGSWDFMPAGAYLQGERIGLRTMTVWTWWIFIVGVLMLMVGGSIAGFSRGDLEMVIVGLGLVAFGVLMFVVWARVRGTVYWLDADGISRPRFPDTRVRWVDIERIDQYQTWVFLRTDRRIQSVGRRGKGLRISTGALEISQGDLVQLIQAVRSADHLR